MISIFNGRRRTLGGEKAEVWAQVDVCFRDRLSLFKGARLSVFLAISLHANEEGWAWPSYATLARETGYSQDTVAEALADLCKVTIDGARVLLRYQPQAEAGKFGSNHYLIFPSATEAAEYEGGGVLHLGAESGGAFVKREPAQPSRENPVTDIMVPEPAPPSRENPVTNKNQEDTTTVEIQRIDPISSGPDQLETPAAGGRADGDLSGGQFVHPKTGYQNDTQALPGDAKAAVWQLARGDLQATTTKATFDRWLRGCRLLSLDDGRAVIGSGDPFAVDWLANRLRPVIERSLSYAVGRPVAVAFELIEGR